MVMGPKCEASYANGRLKCATLLCMYRWPIALWSQDTLYTNNIYQQKDLPFALSEVVAILLKVAKSFVTVEVVLSMSAWLWAYKYNWKRALWSEWVLPISTPHVLIKVSLAHNKSSWAFDELTAEFPDSIYKPYVSHSHKNHRISIAHISKTWENI